MTFPVQDRFVPVRTLGSGSFGEVYEVNDLQDDRRVALKVLTRADPELVLRFKKEFRGLAGMAIPGVVGYHELFERDGTWYFTMDLVNGVDLLEWLWEGRDPAGTTVDHTFSLDDIPEEPGATPAAGLEPMGTGLLVDVARTTALFGRLAVTVQALHAAGRIHRDLKPANVLVRADGNVIVLDLGLVAAAEGGASSTQSIAGSPRYMAPETFEGRPGPASDWYAFGVMLHEALTGRPPFDGSIATMLQLKRDPGSVCRASGMPQGPLAELVEALLQPDEQERPSGEDVLARLGAVAVEPASRAVQTDQFFGRPAELGVLGASFERSRKGLELAVVRGESGIGKSALVRAFLRRCRTKDPAVVVLTGRCWARESVSYKALDALMDALSNWLVEQGGGRVDAWLPRDFHELVRLFPVLARVSRRAGAPGIRMTNGGPNQARAVRALAELLGRVADQRPLVLYVDDAQWGDADSGALLADVLLIEPAPRLLIVATVRPGQPGAADPPFLHELAAAFPRGPQVAASAPGGPDAAGALRVRRVELGPLEPEAADALAACLLDARGGSGNPCDDIAQARGHIVREAAGSPMFLAELAAAWTSQGSGVPSVGPARSLDSALRHRAGALDPRATRVIELIAMAGGPVGVRVIHAVMGAEDGTAGLDALLRTQLVEQRETSHGPRLTCAHDRMREAVVAGLGEGGRLTTSGALADALLQVGSPDPGLLAALLEGAGRAKEASAHWLRAAEQAGQSIAWSHAADLYGRAVRHGGLDPAATRSALSGSAQALGASGQRLAAARVCQELAAASTGREQDRFILAAGEHLVRCGLGAEGLAEYQRVARGAGYSIPTTYFSAVLGLIWGELRARLRGYDFVLRDAATMDEPTRWRLEVGGALLRGLQWVDALKGQTVHRTYLRAALDAGAADDIAVALLMEGSLQPHVETRSGRALVIAEGVRRAVAETRRPDALWMVEFAGAMGLFVAGDYRHLIERWDAWTARYAARPDEAEAERDGRALIGQGALIMSARLLEGRRHAALLTREAERAGDMLVLRILAGIPTTLIRFTYGESASDLAAGARETRTIGVAEGNWVVVLGAIATEAEMLCAAGRIGEALEVIDVWYPQVARKGFFQSPVVATAGWMIATRAALMAANAEAAGSPMRRRYMTRARRACDRLPARQMPEAAAWQALFEAELAMLADPRSDPTPAVVKAAALFTQVGKLTGTELMGAFLGLLGDRERHEAAAAWFQGQEITQPQRLLQLTCAVIAHRHPWRAP